MAVNQDDKWVEYWETPLTSQIYSMAISNRGKILINDGNAANPTYVLDRQSGVMINPTGFAATGNWLFPREKMLFSNGKTNVATRITGTTLYAVASLETDGYSIDTEVSSDTGVSAVYGTNYLSLGGRGQLYKLTAGPTYKINEHPYATKITIYQNEVAATNPESMTPLHNYGNGCMRAMIDKHYALFNYGDATNPYYNLYVITTGGSTWSKFYTNYVSNTPLGTYIPYNIVSFEVAYNGDIIALAIDRDSTGAASEIRLLRIDLEGRITSNYLVDTLTDANLQFNGDALAYDGDELGCINLRDKSGSDYYNYIYVVDVYSGTILNKYIPPTTTTAVNYGIALHIGGSRFAATYNHNKIMIV